MIYTLTFNPAIDYVMRTGPLEWGATNRSDGEEIYFGGKGVNVSTVLTRLGVRTTALGFIAGFTGEALDRAVSGSGVRTDFIRLPTGHTRINLKLKGTHETEINARGPEITADDLRGLYEKLEQIGRGDTLVLAGSIPGCLPQNTYEDILARLEGRGVRFAVDATGALLVNTLKYRPFLIKPNRAELEEICGTGLPTDREIADAAGRLREMGAVNVLVSLGGDGALLVDESGKVHRRPAIPGRAVNTVGAGDSMVAGFLAGIDRGYDYDCALRLSFAAGSATAFAPGLASKEEIMALMAAQIK